MTIRVSYTLTFIPPASPSSSRSPSPSPEGLFGQSFDGDDMAVDGAVDNFQPGQAESTTSAQGEGSIEGVIDDYKVSDQFGTTFKFSRFLFCSSKNTQNRE